jgi:hypothetical protein
MRNLIVLPVSFALAMLVPGASFAEGLYAAIAFSPATGQSGTSWNYETSMLAETEAYLQCGAEDCDTVVVFQQCGAIAVGRELYYGYGYDLSSATAIETALQQCDALTTNCEITAAFCNDGY